MHRPSNGVRNSNVIYRHFCGAAVAIQKVYEGFGQVLPIRKDWKEMSKTGLYNGLMVGLHEEGDHQFHDWEERTYAHVSSRDPEMKTNVPVMIAFIVLWLSRLRVPMVLGRLRLDLETIKFEDRRGNLKYKMIAEMKEDWEGIATFVPRFYHMDHPEKKYFLQEVIFELLMGGGAFTMEMAQKDGVSLDAKTYQAMMKNPQEWSGKMFAPKSKQQRKKEEIAALAAAAKGKPAEEGSESESESESEDDVLDQFFHMAKKADFTKTEMMKLLGRKGVTDWPAKIPKLAEITKTLDPEIGKIAERLVRLVAGRTIAEQVAGGDPPETLTTNIFQEEQPDEVRHLGGNISEDIIHFLRGMFYHASTLSRVEGKHTAADQIESLRDREPNLDSIRKILADVCEHKFKFVEGASKIRMSMAEKLNVGVTEEEHSEQEQDQMKQGDDPMDTEDTAKHDQAMEDPQGSASEPDTDDSWKERVTFKMFQDSDESDENEWDDTAAEKPGDSLGSKRPPPVAAKNTEAENPGDSFGSKKPPPVTGESIEAEQPSDSSSSKLPPPVTRQSTEAEKPSDPLVPVTGESTEALNPSGSLGSKRPPPVTGESTKAEQPSESSGSKQPQPVTGESTEAEQPSDSLGSCQPLPVTAESTRGNSQTKETIRKEKQPEPPLKRKRMSSNRPTFELGTSTTSTPTNRTSTTSIPPTRASTPANDKSNKATAKRKTPERKARAKKP